MAARTPHIRTLLRASTSTLRTSQVPNYTSQFSTLPPSAPQLRRSRSPSPPPPYTPTPTPFSSLSLSRATNNQLQPPPSYTPWTRFSTPYSYSSVRHFTSSHPRLHPTPNSNPASSSPNAASLIDPIIEEITELYGTARDEFEIAAEETEKNTTYAADDRAAAREELDKLLGYYQGVLGEEGDRAVAEEVKRRVGGRIRELEQAVLALEESVTHGD